jgi:hypothetical protein
VKETKLVLTVNVMLAPGCDLATVPEALADRLQHLLASDPDDVFPEISTVDEVEFALPDR